MATITGTSGSDAPPTFIGTADADILEGLGGNDTLNGGLGNDTLYGGEGDDTYEFGTGDGFDQIFEASVSSANADRILLGPGIGSGDYRLVRDGSAGLSVVLSSGDTITVAGFFSGAFSGDLTTVAVESLELSGGTVISLTNGLTLTGTDNNEQGNELYGSSEADTIFGLGGADILGGLGGNDTLNGGLGNDTLYGGEGDDTYEFGTGDGFDQIFEASVSSANADRILLGPGIGSGDYRLVRDGSAGLSVVLSSGDTITVAGFFSGAFSGDLTTVAVESLELSGGTVISLTNGLTLTGTDNNEQGNELYGSSEADTIFGLGGADILGGLGGNDTLNGGLGNDTLYGGEGDDTYEFGTGDGFDQIFEASVSSANADRILLGPGIGSGDYRLVRDGSAGLSVVLSSGDTITVAGFFSGAFSGDLTTVAVESLELSGGTVISLTNGLTLTGTDNNEQGNELYGSSEADTIFGLGGADVIDGQGGDDTLDGGTGNDFLYGGAGNDRVLYGGDRANYTVTFNGGDGYTVSDNVGGDGVDILGGIERIVFADETLVLVPTAVTLSNTTASLAENTSTANRIKVGDIAVTDDANTAGNALGLTGTDAAFFEIIGSELFLKAGTALNFEAKSSYAVAVTVDDAALGSSPDATSTTYTLAVTNVNEAPTDILFSASSVQEFRASGTAVATLSATDADAADSFTLALTNNAGGSFAIVGNELRVANGLLLDREQAASHAVSVLVTDSGGLTFTKSLTIGVTDVNPENIIGNASANTLYGGSRADKFDGAGGNDKLFGQAGNDTLLGGSGNDTLTGGAGRDIMTGGSGADDFDYNSITETGKTSSSRDIIMDFTHGSDDIDLSTIDANGTASGNAAFKFLAAKGAAFTGVKGQLKWSQINSSNNALDKTIIEGDINGDRRADFQIELKGIKTLTSSDFIL